MYYQMSINQLHLSFGVKMNLRDLRYLITVAQLRHFGKAADACFVSQPTLSTQLKKLEEELDVILFERTNKQVILTEQGASIVEAAKRVLQEATHLKELAKQFSDPLSGRFHLGLIPTIAPYLLPTIVPGLKKVLPNCEFYFYEEKTESCLRRLKNGELDAAILALPVDVPGLEIKELFREPFLLATAPNHPFVKKSKFKYDDLHEQTFLLLEEGHCLREQVLAVCNAVRDQENQGYRATSLETLRAMVAANMGITLMPKMAIEHQPSKKPDVQFISFPAPIPERTIVMAWRGITAKRICCEKIANLIIHTKKPIKTEEIA